MSTHERKSVAMPAQFDAYSDLLTARAKAIHTAMNAPDREQRRGMTGVWTFVLVTPEGTVLATSEWGTNYEFARAQWEALPVVSEKGGAS